MPRKKGQTNRSIKGRTIKVNPSYSPLFPFTINNQIIDEMRKFTGTETQPQPVPEEYRLYINNLNYPIGSVFMTMVPNITPFDILGIGTWEQINSDYAIRTSSSNQAGSVHQGSTTIGNLFINIPQTNTSSESLSITIPSSKTDHADTRHTHAVVTETSGHPLTEAEMPRHNHVYTTFNRTDGYQYTGSGSAWVGTGGNVTSLTGGNPDLPGSNGVPHSHTVNTSTSYGGSIHYHEIDEQTINNTGTHNHNIGPFNASIDMTYINVTYWIRIA